MPAADKTIYATGPTASVEHGWRQRTPKLC
jgi:hypothetical protein